MYIITDYQFLDFFKVSEIHALFALPIEEQRAFPFALDKCSLIYTRTRGRSIS